MSNLLLSLLVAFYIGYQVDENKMKKYDMIDESGQILKVQFSKTNQYSCPLECGIDHYHYTKKTDNSRSDDFWSIRVYDELDGRKKFNINGADINTYKVIEKSKKRPKNVPLPITGVGFD